MVTLENNHLYITYEYYDYGRKVGRKIIPVKNIECIKANVGARGGMHTWSVIGYNPEYSNESYNKGKEREQSIHSGDRKDSHLIDEIIELMPNIKYIEIKENGGAPW